MDRYIGIDAHDKSCSVVVLDASGREIQRAVLETNGALIREFVHRVPKARHLALEEGALSQWLYELLEPEVEELVVFVPPKHSGPKDDYRDARRAAEQLRTHAIDCPVYKPGREGAQLRCSVRGYQVIRKDLTRAKLRLSALVRSRAIFAGAEVYEPDSRALILTKLPPEERTLAELLGRQVDALEQLKEEAAKNLRAAAAASAAVQLLATAPGFGTIRASTVVAIVGTPHRFRTTRQFWSYCGLGIVRRSSSDWVAKERGWARAQKDVTRGLNRNRNAWLKEVFKGAATGLIARSPDHPLVEGYRRRVAAGIAPNLAVLTLARQQAAIILSMWKNGEEYDPNKKNNGSQKMVAA